MEGIPQPARGHDKAHHPSGLPRTGGSLRCLTHSIRSHGRILVTATSCILSAKKSRLLHGQHGEKHSNPLSEFLLGVGITRDPEKRGQLHSHQRQFILDILERYNMSDCSPVLTPMSPGLVLTKEMGASSPEDVEYMKDVPYLSCIGSLQYLASMTPQMTLLKLWPI